MTDGMRHSTTFVGWVALGGMTIGTRWQAHRQIDGTRWHSVAGSHRHSVALGDMTLGGNHRHLSPGAQCGHSGRYRNSVSGFRARVPAAPDAVYTDVTRSRSSVNRRIPQCTNFLI